MTVKELIEKITDETTVEDILIDLAIISEEEVKKNDLILDLNDKIIEKDEIIKSLKEDNYSLLKKVSDSVNFKKDNEAEDEPEVVKSTEEIFEDFNKIH